MADKQKADIFLVGNPNTGKSSLFNLLTGLRQKVGNFPGVTVEEKTGVLKFQKEEYTVLDLPGTYSLFPASPDEFVVTEHLSVAYKQKGSVVVCVADVTHLEKHLLLFSQIRDLQLPMVLALNMKDVAEEKGIVVDVPILEKELGIPVAYISSRTGDGVEALKAKAIQQIKSPQVLATEYEGTETARQAGKEISDFLGLNNVFNGVLHAHYAHKFKHVSAAQLQFTESIRKQYAFKSVDEYLEEIMWRFKKITPLVRSSVHVTLKSSNRISDIADRIFTHPVAGPIIFLALMLLVFQAIFSWSSYPMDGIEWLFAEVGKLVSAHIPSVWLSGILSDGVIAGLSGVLVFVPQIAILMLLISILEESGYMARVVYLFDHLMQRFGLNGRSMVALISGGACAIPAIMSTRTIGNWKERLITILVTPLISCSARIPVFTILIAVTVPSKTIAGLFNLQAITFMGLYLLGIFAALLMAYLFKKILKTEDPSYLIMEMPAYQWPQWKNVGINVYEKVKAFVVDAGKIIMLVSIILWFLASYGPDSARKAAELEAIEMAAKYPEKSLEQWQASYKLESSYAGIAGKMIEPLIQPLGYDWKIGIALISSFAAREVFVGTMATIYAVDDTGTEEQLTERMQNAVNPQTQKPIFSYATAFSLLVFYLFAMQCMSTLAIVKRETNSWKWPAIQFGYMTLLAYGASALVYQVLK